MPEVTERIKRPVRVRTLEWTGDNLAEMRAFCGHYFRLLYDEPGGRRIGAEVFDKLHASWITVYVGQHVVQGVRGEFYPIDGAVLEETYEPAGALA
jgi:hypothetical protein